MQYLQYLIQKVSLHLYYWTFSGSHQIWSQMSGISLCNQGRLLFHNNVHFFKKNVEPETNVLIACYDGQEVSELVDYYVLNQLKTVIRKEFLIFIVMMIFASFKSYQKLKSNENVNILWQYLKAHRQVSEKRCLGKCYSCDKACQFSAW